MTQVGRYVPPEESFKSKPFRLARFTNERIGGEEVILKIDCELLTDYLWSEYFGEVEQELESNDFLRLEISFKRIKWTDPIPFLSLLVCIARLISRGVSVEINFPIPEGRPRNKIEDTGGVNPRLQTNGSRFLIFLAKEGFIESLLNLGAQVILRGLNRQVKVTTVEDIKAVLSEYERLAYQNSTALKVEVLALNEFNDAERLRITEVLSSRLNEVDFQNIIQSEVDSRFKEELISRLRVVLIEVVINVAEHAYEFDKNGRKVAAYYVRFRRGLNGAGQHEEREIQSLISAERQSSPKLDATYLEHRRACFEIFISDAGDGVVKKIAQRYKLQDKRDPLRFYLENILVDGKSSNDDRRTARGALSLIYMNSSRAGDYLRLFSNNAWFGTSAPMTKKSLTKYAKQRPCPKGVHWQFRLGWQASTDNDESWSSLHDEEAGTADVLAAYSRNLKKEELDDFNEVLTVRGRQRFDTSEKSEIKAHLEKNPRTSVCVWYAGRNLLKNDILTRVALIGDLKHKPLSNLYIVDIENYEADIYLWSLRELATDLRNEWCSWIPRIILVTVTWKVCVLDYRRANLHGYGWNKEESKLFMRGRASDAISLRGDSSIVDLAIFFRWHASLQFWRKLISENKQNSVYFNGKVEWSDKPPLTIQGYLDFGQAASIGLGREILTAELKRYALACGNSLPELYAFDSYVASIVSHVEWSLGGASNVERERQGVGSVLVTGKTLEAHNAQKSGKYIHFFAHPNALASNGAARTLLFWPTDYKWFKRYFPPSAEVRRRIGSTAAVSIEGNKTFNLPRWRAKGKSVAIRPPAPTYQDMQDTPPLAQGGHWSDGAHHDFLSINIKNAINRSDIAGHGMFSYLAACIISSLNIDLGNLSKIGVERFEQAKGDCGIDRPEFQLKVCAVVYPMKGDAAHIIELFLERYVLAEHQAKIGALLIGVGDIRATTSKYPILVSPAAAGRIKSVLKLAPEGNENILFLDDAVITGKTNSEIESVLKGLGAKSVHSVVCVDRRRLPGSRASQTDLYSYWRLDIPPLGDSYSCPICAARSDLGLLTSLLSSTQLLRHAESVRERWKPVDPNRDWGMMLRGVPTKPFDLRYGLDAGVGKEARNDVRIMSSTAATLWYVELETMTGSELALDKALAKVEKNVGADDMLIPLARLELRSSAVLYFSSGIVPKRLIAIVQEIFTDVINTPNSGEHTSLGCLAILSAVDFIKSFEGALDEVLDECLTRDVETLSDDARLLLAALLARGAIKRTHPKISAITRLLGIKMTLAERYNIFHAELLSPIGNVHGRPLSRIAEGVDFDLSGALIREAVASCDFLLMFLASIPFEYAASAPAVHSDEDNPNLAEALESSLRKAKGVLERVGEKGSNFTAATPSCVEVMSLLRQLQARLAVPANLIKKALSALYQEVVVQLYGDEEAGSKTLSWTSFENNIELRADEQRWVVWDSQVRILLKDLLKNACMHGANRISNPFGAQGAKTSNIWVSATLDYGAVSLKFANSVHPDVGRPKRSIDKKGVMRFRRLEELGGSVSHTVENGVFCVAVVLPYMAHCREPVKEG